MGVKLNPFTGKLDVVDSPSGDFTDLDVNGDITLDDGGTYTTTVQVVTPTANRTISFPDATGTVALVAGSTGQVTYNNAGAQAGLTSASIGSTDEINISLAGAASTPPVSFTGSWFTGGTATTTKPQLLIEPTGTTSTAWSTDGTGLGVNAESGFSGRLLDLQTNGTSQMVVQGDGKLLVGTASARSNVAGVAPGIQLEGADNNTPRSFGQIYGKSDAAGPLFLFAKHRSNSIGGQTVVSSGDELGQIVFNGSDGTNFVQGAVIKGEVDGTPGANDMPGRLVFSTTADGASTPTEHVRISNTGDVYLRRALGSERVYFTNSGAGSIGTASYAASSTTLYIGNAAIQVSSDVRLKDNIEDTKLDALDALARINVKDFTWNDPTDTSFNNRNARGKWTGLIAQELVEVLPFVVNAPRKEEDGSIDYDSEERWLLDQSQLCPVLIKAIQQQQEIIAGLEARLATLEAQ